jgi:hypothetical protein
VSKQTQGVLKPQLSRDIHVPNLCVREEIVMRGSSASFAAYRTKMEPHIGAGRCLFDSVNPEE